MTYFNDDQRCLHLFCHILIQGNILKHTEPKALNFLNHSRHFSNMPYLLIGGVLSNGSPIESSQKHAASSSFRLFSQVLSFRSRDLGKVSSYFSQTCPSCHSNLYSPVLPLQPPRQNTPVGQNVRLTLRNFEFVAPGV